MSQPRSDKLAEDVSEHILQLVNPSLLLTTDETATDYGDETLIDPDSARELWSAEWPMHFTGGARSNWRFAQERKEFREPVDKVFNQIRGLRKVPDDHH